MSLLTDIKNVSDNAIEQLSRRFHDLPRPLLAAIGAGDMAVERLAALREQLTSAVGSGGATPSGDDVKAFAADLPARAQQIAGDVAHNLEQFAASAPDKVQQLIGELPAKTSELTDSLSPDNIRGTVEAYTQFVATIYDNLAERGEKAVAKADPGRSGRTAPAPATPSRAASAPDATKTAARRTATRKPATARQRAATKTATKTATKPATATKTPKPAKTTGGATTSTTAAPKRATRRTAGPATGESSGADS